MTATSFRTCTFKCRAYFWKVMPPARSAKSTRLFSSPKTLILNGVRTDAAVHRDPSMPHNSWVTAQGYGDIPETRGEHNHGPSVRCECRMRLQYYQSMRRGRGAHIYAPNILRVLLRYLEISRLGHAQ